MFPDEQPFLDAVRQRPDDETQRLIYADWLEERGDWRGEYVRQRQRLQTSETPLEVLTEMLPLFERHDFEMQWWSSQLGFRPLFLCRECHVPVTLPVRRLDDSNRLTLIDGENLVPRGFFAAAELTDEAPGKAGETAVHLQDAAFTQHHSDTRRLTGCCGPDGTDGLNTLCRSGHEIGTERSDCWMPHALWLDAKHIDRV